MCLAVSARAQLSGRRLQNHGGIVHAKGLIPATLPAWLQQLLNTLPSQLLDMFPADQPPNHVLINSYQPGCGIMVGTSSTTVPTVLNVSAPSLAMLLSARQAALSPLTQPATNYTTAAAAVAGVSKCRTGQQMP